MYLIIGVGNPEKQYKGTRHNIGFIVLDKIATRAGIAFESKKNLLAELGRGKLTVTHKKKNKNIPVIIAKPSTFVNQSGDAVKKIKEKYHVKPNHIIVIHDDLDIPFEKTKLAFNASSAGHRGINSIIHKLKTKKFYRIKIGIANSQIYRQKKKAKNKKDRDELVKNFVLAPFSPKEKKRLAHIAREVTEKIETILKMPSQSSTHPSAR